MRFILPKPEGGFTQIHNSLLRHPLRRGNHAAFISLFEALSYGSRPYANRSTYCREVGIPLKTWEKHMTTLLELGVLVTDGKDYVVQVDGEIAEQVNEQVTEQVTEQVEKRIAEEIAEQPRRQLTGLSQKDRWELIKTAWNKNRPEGYLLLDGRVNLPLLIAIETQTKRLGVDRDDYEAFIGAVLRGAKADPWWSSKEMKASQIFGFGAELDDRKFENVERLYRAGSALTPRTEKKQAGWDDDQTLIDWYKKTCQAPDDLRILRLTVEDESQARDLEDWHRLSKDGRPIRGAEMFYYDRLQGAVESGRLPYDKSRFDGTARIYYQKDRLNPIWWTSREFVQSSPVNS